MLDRLTKSYGRGTHQLIVVQNVSLMVAAGETVWLRGPSGSGKSSLLRMAGLLSTPDSGRISLNSKEVSAKYSSDVRRDLIGFVFQHSNLLPDLSLADNVLVAKRSATRRDVLAKLDTFGLLTIADRPAKQVSGGEAQRAALCRALIGDPILVLVDEPTSGLDADSASVVRAHLDDAKGRGRAILVASHDPVMASIADRTIDMKGGTLE